MPTLPCPALPSSPPSRPSRALLVAALLLGPACHRGAGEPSSPGADDPVERATRQAGERFEQTCVARRDRLVENNLIGVANISHLGLLISGG